jgi:hypothetical protein
MRAGSPKVSKILDAGQVRWTSDEEAVDETLAGEDEGHDVSSPGIARVGRRSSGSTDGEHDSWLLMVAGPSRRILP